MKFKTSFALFLIVILVFSSTPVWGAQGGTPITVENAASVTQLALLEGHTGAVFSLAFSPDSAMLASGGSQDDYTVRLWDVASASQKALLEGHTAQIAAVGFNADGTQVESASYDGSIRLWDSATGAALETLDGESTGFLDLGFISNLATYLSADGSRLSYAPGGFSINIFDLTSREGRALDPLGSALSDVVGSAANVRVSADGTIAALEEADGGPIHLLDLDTETEIGKLERPDPDSYYFSALAISPDNKTLAAVDDTSMIIQLWDMETGESGAALSGHAEGSGVYGMNFSPDGIMLASASYDATIRLWDVAAGTELVSLETSDPNGSGVVVWSLDGSLLASANLDGTIQIWSVSS